MENDQKIGYAHQGLLSQFARSFTFTESKNNFCNTVDSLVAISDDGFSGTVRCTADGFPFGTVDVLTEGRWTFVSLLNLI